MSSHYIIFKGEEILKLKKGMTLLEVKSMLGKPFQIDKCTNPLNKKLIYKIKSSAIMSSYMILFNQDLIVYVAKTT